MWTDGHRTKTNRKTSPEQSAIFQLVQEINKTNALTKKTAPPPWQPYIYKTNLFTKFHDDWAKNVTSRVTPPPGSHVIQLTGTIFQLNSRIKETNVLTKFHENWAKNVTSTKNAPPTGGHVFSRSGPFFNTSDISIKPIVFTRKTAPPTGGHFFFFFDLVTYFELDRDFIGTKLLTKFHEDRTINVASRVFTNKCLRTDGRTDGHTMDKDRSQKLT
ncbi:hypothetical protein DPMN_181052 [Dreissena polymorpha]|uniref:Uncharacterized protein n=1 Tax=Dreissena polymorpha TaxID=45954 RepID=A0A9D4DBL4_DREPO|nr:hypothetical protein DPMN_181052 [Dreissena polymorpha]